MSLVAWIVCLAWLAAAAGMAAVQGVRGIREGRGRLVAMRLRSPTIYLFSAYLLIAGLVTPKSAGETTSPLFWLALALPILHALASMSSIGPGERSPARSIVAAVLYGGSVFAAAAIILAIASPRFVPGWLKGAP